MNHGIIFEPWREEVIRDNHGCPCRTDYLTTFKVGGVNFSALFANLARVVDIYHGYHHVTGVRVDKRSTAEVEKLIKAEFAKDGALKEYWQKAQAEYLKQVGEKLLHEVLSNDDSV